MKCKKQFAALLLSVTLLAGISAPSFAEPQPEDPAAATTQTDPAQTTDSVTDTTGTDETDAQTTEPTSDTDTSETEPPADNTDTHQPNETEEDTSVLHVNAQASILVNEETGEIIHAENETEKAYPASTTKIMTALLALEKCNLDDVVTMQDEDFIDVNNGASNAGLKVGEQITVENLLYCLLLPSGNEAAN
ncbi:MAG: serine hydrolase, partial [Eubacteriales bacterium]|nr:serine hydrolase [Eubacteriales bacterium]